MHEADMMTNATERGDSTTTKVKDHAPTVVIFGAGITGLTVAHELVERGWHVTVVEKEIDPANVDECAIGGLAKTQWSVYQAPSRETDGPTEALPLVPTVRLRRGVRADVLLEKLKASGVNDESTPESCKEAIKDWTDGELGEDLETGLDVGSNLYLARVAARIESIRPSVPALLVTFGSKACRLMAVFVGAYLLRLGARKVCVPKGADADLPTKAWQVETDLTDNDTGEEPPGPRDISGILPGEHGFRFFPALYRHLFDTLRRIPVRGADQGFGDVYRTVYDNLIPTESNWLAIDDQTVRPGLDDARPKDVVRFPRRLRKSIREVLDAMLQMQTELGYTERDIELLKLRLLKYMTSCRRRRKEQYEGMSWSAFAGLSDLSEACRNDMKRAPQLIAAMTAEESDARTQGNLATQLLFDPINADERVDSTLNAPTTVAWFAPWKDYLLSQDVRFVPGSLDGFVSAEGRHEIRPKLSPKAHFGREPAGILEADYYVLALPVQAWSDGGLIEEWEKARAEVSGLLDHVDRLKTWLCDHVRPKRLYKGLTGIQFYFDADHLARSGHTLFMDSAWCLSAISQTSFWNRRREPFDGYRGLVSVDIGSFTDADQDGRSFLQTKKTDVHASVWRQIDPGDAYATSAGKPSGEWSTPYRTYRIDEYIQYPEEGEPRNLTPFLINGVDEWDHRAGWDLPKGCEPEHVPAEERSPARYQLMPVHSEPAAGTSPPLKSPPRWVLAGTFMQTWTRATTMEAANESARHAVNTLLHDASKRSEYRRRQPEPCRIWNPEEYEHPDLRIWKELDERLYKREVDQKTDGTFVRASTPAKEERPYNRDVDEECDKTPLPHMFDILDLEKLPDAFLDFGDPACMVNEMMASVINTRGGR